jgi:hypothetical protein
MPEVSRVVYSITKQVRQYEPVRIEVEVVRTTGDAATELLDMARAHAEEAMAAVLRERQR